MSFILIAWNKQNGETIKAYFNSKEKAEKIKNELTTKHGDKISATIQRA